MAFQLNSNKANFRRRRCIFLFTVHDIDGSFLRCFRVFIHGFTSTATRYSMNPPQHPHRHITKQALETAVTILFRMW